MSTFSVFLLQAGYYVRIAVEIGLLASLIYMVLLFLHGTRAMMVLAGIIIVSVAMATLSRLLGLEVIEWLMLKMWTLLAVAVLILFQPELRRAFAEIASRRAPLRLGAHARRERELIEKLVEATYFLASHRIGALFAIEQNIGLRAFAETGTAINAPLTVELLTTLFFPNTPLHDGGVIIRDGTIAAAGCIFPLTPNPDLSKSLGTRHRAAVGITEETDAVVIVVSEETGAVSLARQGRLVRGVDRERLERHLTNYLARPRVGQAGGGLKAVVASMFGERGRRDDESAEEPAEP